MRRLDFRHSVTSCAGHFRGARQNQFTSLVLCHPLFLFRYVNLISHKSPGCAFAQPIRRLGEIHPCASGPLGHPLSWDARVDTKCHNPLVWTTSAKQKAGPHWRCIFDRQRFARLYRKSWHCSYDLELARGLCSSGIRCQCGHNSKVRGNNFGCGTRSSSGTSLDAAINSRPSLTAG